MNVYCNSKNCNLIHLLKPTISNKHGKVLNFRQLFTSITDKTDIRDNEKNDSEFEKDQFRVMELTHKPLQRKARTYPNDRFFKEPREKSQSINQNWGDVWPGQRTFHPATVPIPVRMGVAKRKIIHPDKYGNAELMKIPNFLHLTPPVIKHQCEAIEKFCSPWPKELGNEEFQKTKFPVTVKKSTYLHSAPTLRDPRARIVTYIVDIDSLHLNEQSFDKLLRLVGDRYHPETKQLILVVDRCPLFSQNLDYCKYLLTVLCSESKKSEPWEDEKELLDEEKFELKEERKLELIELANKTGSDKSEVESYEKSLSTLLNEGESEENLENYKATVLKMMNLS